MTLNDNRERAAEAKYAKDLEKSFLVKTRCDWLLALWAAEKMGMHHNLASLYARNLTHANLQSGEDVAEKIYDDFKSTGIALTPTDVTSEQAKIRHAVEELLSEKEKGA